MTKNPRDPRMWTNKDIEEDSASFLAAKLRHAFDSDPEGKETLARGVATLVA